MQFRSQCHVRETSISRHISFCKNNRRCLEVIRKSAALADISELIFSPRCRTESTDKYLHLRPKLMADRAQLIHTKTIAQYSTLSAERKIEFAGFLFESPPNGCVNDRQVSEPHVARKIARPPVRLLTKLIVCADARCQMPKVPRKRQRNMGDSWQKLPCLRALLLDVELSKNVRFRYEADCPPNAGMRLLIKNQFEFLVDIIRFAFRAHGRNIGSTEGRAARIWALGIRREVEVYAFRHQSVRIKGGTFLSEQQRSDGISGSCGMGPIITIKFSTEKTMSSLSSSRTLEE